MIEGMTETNRELLALPALLLGAAGSLVEAMQSGVQARGFADIRPARASPSSASIWA
jgi:hypothetical protein